jgi:hypothetical protein
VNHVVLDDAVEDVAANEAKLTINGRSGTLDKRPVFGFVVRGILMGVVKVSDGNYNWLADMICEVQVLKSYQSSGSSTGKAGHMPIER